MKLANKGPVFFQIYTSALGYATSVPPLRGIVPLLDGAVRRSAVVGSTSALRNRYLFPAVPTIRQYRSAMAVVRTSEGPRQRVAGGRAGQGDPGALDQEGDDDADEDEDAAEDARVLSIQRDAAGIRHRDFRDAAALLKEND